MSGVEAKQVATNNSRAKIPKDSDFLSSVLRIFIQKYTVGDKK